MTLTINYVVNLIKSLEHVREFSEELVGKSIRLCKTPKVLRNLKHSRALYIKCLAVLESIPHSDYKKAQLLTDNLSALLIYLADEYKSTVFKLWDGVTFVVKKRSDLLSLTAFVSLMLPASSLSLYHAERLERLCLPGDSFYYLIRSLDPYNIKYDRFTKTGNLKTESGPLFRGLWHIEYKLSGTFVREIFLRRSSLHFKLLNILGMTVDQAIETHINTQEMLNWEKEAEIFDIVYMCSLLEQVSRDPKKIEYCKKIIMDLSLQYKIEEVRSAEASYIIAKTLSKVLKEPIWTKRALKYKIDSFEEEYFALQLRLNSQLGVIDEDENITLIFFILNKIEIKWPDDMLFALQKQRFIEYITEIIVLSLEGKNYSFVINASYIWLTSVPNNLYNLPKDPTYQILFGLPNYPDNQTRFLLMNEDGISLITGVRTMTLERIIDLKNHIESTWSVIANLPVNEPYLDPKIYENLSIEYLNSIKDYFGTESLVGKMSSSPVLYYDLPSLSLPVISVIALQGDYEIASIIRTPGVEEHLKHILIWTNPDETLHMTVFELEAIKLLINNPYYILEVYEGAECSKDLFLEKYADSKYDLIYVMSHSEINTDDPSQSYITISMDDIVTVWELFMAN